MGGSPQPVRSAFGPASRRTGRGSLPAYAPDHAGAKGEPDGHDHLQKSAFTGQKLRRPEVSVAAHAQTWVLPAPSPCFSIGVFNS